jgi:hypothetical protein
MSELNRIAQEYLESLGAEIPVVVDASPRTFDTKPKPPAKIQNTLGMKLRARDAVIGKTMCKSPVQHPAYSDVELTPAQKWDLINFPPPPEPEEVKPLAPAWRIWPTGNEVRAAVLIGIFILAAVAYFAMVGS